MRSFKAPIIHLCSLIVPNKRFTELAMFQDCFNFGERKKIKHNPFYKISTSFNPLYVLENSHKKITALGALISNAELKQCSVFFLLEQIIFQPGIHVASSSEYKDPTAEKVPSDGEYAQTKEYVRNRYFLFVNVGTKHFYSVLSCASFLSS